MSAITVSLWYFRVDTGEELRRIEVAARNQVEAERRFRELHPNEPVVIVATQQITL